MTKVVSKEFANFNKGTSLDNGDWKVEVRMVETFVYDDNTIGVESLEAMCIDSDFSTAHQIALASVLEQYRSEVYDKGMDSLIESRKKFGVVNDKSNDNKDTITQ